MNEENLMANRLCELAVRAYNNNYYTYTEFLGLMEQSILHRLAKSDERMRGIGYTVYGGIEDAERVVAAFGNREELGYEPEFSIACLRVSPLNDKFSDRLTHRDYLGALMNLGIKREQVGDIYISGNCGYIYCLTGMADYLINNLNQIKHTNVSCVITDESPDIQKNQKELVIQVPSERIDVITAKAYKLSRGTVMKLIAGKKVFINGCLCESSSKTVCSNDIVSVRGYGRYRYTGVVGTTGKGNLKATINVY
ncbi:MAG: hypothetical protein E7265_06180 [Lachnospiraceae bacterium]|nr:hypothetical protein [Lachnospiraceae bacterium]